MAKALALVALLVAGCAALASATMYTVGDGQGWTTGVDYAKWGIKDKAFAVGDRLVFNYPPKLHTVTEVSRSDYDGCSGRNALRDDDNGNTVVPLDTPGWHYFICNVSDHCASGMKLAVLVSPTPTGAAGDALVPAMGSVVAAAAGAAIKLALL